MPALKIAEPPKIKFLAGLPWTDNKAQTKNAIMKLLAGENH